jgi:integrase
VVHGQPTGKWFVDIPASLTRNGKRKRKLYPSMTQAETIARELRRRLKMRELGYAPKVPTSNLTFEQGACDWEAAQQRRLRTGKIHPNTLKTRVHELKPLKRFFGGYRLDAIIPSLMERYQERRLQEGCTPRTVNSELATFKQVFRWLVGQGRLSFVPSVECLRIKRLIRDIPTRAEVVALIRHLPKRVRPIVRLMSETGMRPGEVFNLSWEHVNEVEGYIDILPFRDWQPKTEHSMRRIWLSSDLLREMRRLPKKGTYVFSGRNPDEPIRSIRKALLGAVRKARLVRDGKPMNPTPKTFRKAFATWHAEDGVHPSLLQRQMGHVAGSRMTEQCYIFAGDEAVRQAFKPLPFGQPERKKTKRPKILAKSGNMLRKVSVGGVSKAPPHSPQRLANTR